MSIPTNPDNSTSAGAATPLVTTTAKDRRRLAKLLVDVDDVTPVSGGAPMDSYIKMTQVVTIDAFTRFIPPIPTLTQPYCD